MGVMFYQNGAAIGTDAGWGGFTGNNNYVVRYDFTTGAAGASQAAIGLSNIFYGHGAGTQSFGFKISASPAEWCNARAVPPDSNTAKMVYSASTGYGCVLTANALKLLPYTKYYIFVYLAGGGAEYYTGWNCVNPQIVYAGSYTQDASTIDYLSPAVSALGSVSLTMKRAGGNYHRASFSCGGETLAVSDAFAASLSYVCPRSWLRKDTAEKHRNAAGKTGKHRCADKSEENIDKNGRHSPFKSQTVSAKRDCKRLQRDWHTRRQREMYLRAHRDHGGEYGGFRHVENADLSVVAHVLFPFLFFIRR